MARRRCNVCRDYFIGEEMTRLGSVWVCSVECKTEKLRSTKSQAVKRDHDRSEAQGKPAVRQQVIKRDGEVCLLCGRHGSGLHLHRVRYGSEGGKYEPDNCVLLCNRHHNMGSADDTSVHGNKKLWQPLLLEHLSGGGAKHTLRKELRAAQGRVRGGG